MNVYLVTNKTLARAAAESWLAAQRSDWARSCYEGSLDTALVPFPARALVPVGTPRVPAIIAEVRGCVAAPGEPYQGTGKRSAAFVWPPGGLPVELSALIELESQLWREGRTDDARAVAWAIDFIAGWRGPTSGRAAS